MRLYLFCDKNTFLKKGKSATCTAMEKASVSIQHENINPTQFVRTRFIETAYSGASGDPRLSDGYFHEHLSTMQLGFSSNILYYIFYSSNSTYIFK